MGDSLTPQASRLKPIMPWGVPGVPAAVELCDWLGIYQPGDLLPLRLVTIDKDGAASNPSASPTFQILDGNGTEVVAVTKLPIRNRYAFDTAGTDFCYFEHHYLVDSNFTTGSHMLLFRYTISGTTYMVTRTFYVDATGGDADGAVLSMDRIPRPEADNVLYRTRRGRERIGRNPH